MASWNSRRPRAETSIFISSLRNLLLTDNSWNPDVIQNVNQLLDLDVSPAKQFPRRVLRSTIQKLTLAIHRQLIVMAVEPEKAKHFENKSRKLFVGYLEKYEQELYQLCDEVESLRPDMLKY